MALLSQPAIDALRFLAAAAVPPARAWVPTHEHRDVLTREALVELEAAGLVETTVTGGTKASWRAMPIPVRQLAILTAAGAERLRRIEGARVRREMAWE